MEYLPCENPMKWALCCISIQQFLFPKGGIAAFFMPVGDVDKGQKPYYNDTRMQRELLREAERKDTSTFTPDLDNANGGNAGSNQAGSVVVRMQVTKDFQWGSPFFTEKNDRTASVRKEKEGVFAMNGKQEKSYVLKMFLL